jgi:3-oxoacyl-[acyl-carrier-protein] synthase II
METRELAERRGAKILGCVAGFASRFEPPGDPYKPRTGAAIRQSIQAALTAAELAPHEIGHVNAHGDGSIVEDRVEAEAIRDTLRDVPVTALKSYFGDLGAGSGAVELIGSVLALMHGRVPPTLNYEEADPACPVNVIHGKAKPIGKPAAMALNHSNTGQAVAVVISKN